jgi:hypothetical protein
MNRTLLSGVASAILCVATLGASLSVRADELITNGPQASRGDYGDWSAARNVIQSEQYERLLRTNPGFRQARARKECGPINDPQLHSDCLASFNPYEPPMHGSSPPPSDYRNNRDLGE